MINNKLTINGQSISKEDDIIAFFQEKHFFCEIEDYCLEVEFSPDRNAFIGWLNGDEEVYYFGNGSGNTDSVPLLINVRMEFPAYKLEHVEITDTMMKLSELFRLLPTKTVIYYSFSKMKTRFVTYNRIWS